jgi:hypothetical protein
MSRAETDAVLTSLMALHLRERARTGEPEPEGAQRRRADAKAAPQDDHAFIARDPVVNVFQSALEQYFEERARDQIEEAPHGGDRQASARVAQRVRALRDASRARPAGRPELRLGPFLSRQSRNILLLSALCGIIFMLADPLTDHLPPRRRHPADRGEATPD